MPNISGQKLQRGPGEQLHYKKEFEYEEQEDTVQIKNYQMPVCRWRRVNECVYGYSAVSAGRPWQDAAE
jgi:hypothetical protein